MAFYRRGEHVLHVHVRDRLAARLVAALGRRPLLVALAGRDGFWGKVRAGVFDHYLAKPADPAMLATLMTAHAWFGGR